MGSLLRACQFRVIDTETTGLDPRSDAVVEVAWAIVRGDGTTLTAGASLVNPGRSIPVEAARVHGIRDQDVASAPPLSEVFERNTALWSPTLTAVMHNASFDAAFLQGFQQFRAGNPDILCSLRLATNLLPNMSSYRLDDLRGRLGLSSGSGAGASHRAAGDVAATTALLMRLIDVYLNAGYPDDVDAFAQFSEIFRMPFGKHQGEQLTDVPPDYIDWLLGREIDDDLRRALEKARRGALRVPQRRQ